MRFRLRTILWVFALYASAAATFGFAMEALLTLFVCGVWWILLTPSKHKIAEVSITAAFLFAVLAFLLPASQYSRIPSVRNSCLNNLKNITLALENYAVDHGSYPPAYLVDEDGKPMHSWRVLLLPYLEQQDLYDAYSFDEPWDGPNNRQLWKHMPDVYCCPGRTQAAESYVLKNPPHTTNYFAVVGDETIWPGSKAISPSRPVDRGRRTIAIVESAQAIPWMQPRDLNPEQAIELLTGDNEKGHVQSRDQHLSVSVYLAGPSVGFTDERADWLRCPIDEASAKSLLDPRSGTDSDWEEPGTSASRHSESVVSVKWSRVYALSVFVVLVLLPATHWLPRYPAGPKSSST